MKELLITLDRSRRVNNITPMQNGTFRRKKKNKIKKGDTKRCVYKNITITTWRV